MAIPDYIPFSEDSTALLGRFSNYLYARAGLADSTIAATIGFIRRMLPVTGPAPSRETIERYIADMRRRGDSYGNVTNAMAAIERFAQFLGDPIHFNRPRKPEPVPITVLTEAKTAILISTAPTLRLRAILAVLAYSGCRNNELIELRVRDVDIARQTVTIERGKGAKGRVCCIAGECVEILMDYLRELGGEPDDFLFVTVRRHHRLQTQDVRKLVRVAARRAGIQRRVWPHLFRHSLATALLNRGASAYSIQAQLGHSDVSTTMEYYLHPNARAVRADYYRCCPSFV